MRLAIHRKPFAAHQAFAQAALHHGLEEVPQDVALPEAAMAAAREGGMVRNLAVQSQTAEPSIGEVKVDFSQSRRSDRMPMQYPTTSIRIINSGAPDGRPIVLERLQFRAYALQIEELVDPSKEVVIRDMIIETEIVEQLRRCHLRSDHRAIPSGTGGWNHDTASRSTPTKSTQSALTGRS
jgi:hypothetical protein